MGPPPVLRAQQWLSGQHDGSRGSNGSRASTNSKKAVASNLVEVQDELRSGATRAHQDEMGPPPVLRAQQWLSGQHDGSRGSNGSRASTNLDELDHLNETTPVAQRWLSSSLERVEAADSQAIYLDAELASSAPETLADNLQLACRHSAHDPELGMPVALGTLPAPSRLTNGVPRWASERSEEEIRV